jgi:hypothetical protein
LAGTNVQFLADFLGKNNLSFGGCFYNGHVFYLRKKVLLYVWNMTELKPFVKMAILLRDGVLLAAWRRSGSGGSSAGRDFWT